MQRYIAQQVWAWVRPWTIRHLDLRTRRGTRPESCQDSSSILEAYTESLGWVEALPWRKVAVFEIWGLRSMYLLAHIGYGGMRHDLLLKV